MEFDLGDSLTSSQEHHTDTIPDLFASEADHMPSRSFFSRLKNRDFYAPFRSEAISHISQAQFSCNLDPFISYLAINYMDRYVSKQEIPQGKPWISRLMVIGCLSLASKMKNSPFSVSDIHREEGLVFDAQTVHKMELLILDTLSWRMRSITPFSFFSFFISFIEINDSPLTQALKDRASDIIFCSQNDMKFLEYKPSIIAASALLSASHELFIQQFASFKASLLACQYVKSENLLKCFNMMQEMVAMQGYVSNSDTLSGTRTPMSVLEREITNSEGENSMATTTSSAQICVTSPMVDKDDNKRRKLNGLCSSSSSRFQLSQFHHY
ncbi:putative cyclin-D6-1 [Humulus lupulus]|uniref:putative cyclin-D6-1 n=1 Tax=Humulus lupulus TaxID=3486 RepID=UPI002B40F481|nr:putative cyclin-D6-1 [Humulus lupulus]